MLFPGFAPSFCYYTPAGRSWGVNMMYPPFHGYPGGCYVHGKPRVRRSTPACQLYVIPSSALTGPSEFGGSWLDSLLSVPAQHPYCQQSQSPGKVSANTWHEGSPKPQTAEVSTELKPTATQNCPCQQQQQQMEGLFPEVKESCCAKKKERCCSGDNKQETSTAPSTDKLPEHIWVQQINLQGFAPGDVQVQAADGVVHAHAKMEKSSGPGPCISRYEVMRTVKLPADVDQQTVSCVMAPSGTLFIYAPRMTHSPLEEKTDEPEAATQETTEKKEEEKQEEEIKAVLPDSKPAEEATAKAETTMDKKDMTTEENAFAKLAEPKPSTLPEMHPASNDIPTEHQTTDHATEEPKRLAEDTTETLKSEKEAQVELEDVTEEKGKVGSNPEYPGYQSSEDDVETCRKNLSEGEDMHSSEPCEKCQQSEENQTPVEDGVFACLMYLFGDHASEDDEEFEIITAGMVTEATNMDREEVTTQPVLKTKETIAEQQQHNAVSETPASDTDLTHPIKRDETAEECMETAQHASTPAEENNSTPDNTSTPAAEKASAPAPENTPASEDKPVTENTSTPSPANTCTPAPENPSQSPQNMEPFCTVVPLRGYLPQNLHIQLKDHFLIVSAEREGNLGGMVFTDRTQGKLELPAYIDTASVRCLYRDDSMLVVTGVPKCAHKQSSVK